MASNNKTLKEYLGVTNDMIETELRFEREEPLARIALQGTVLWTQDEFKQYILDKLPKERWNEEEKEVLKYMLEVLGVVRLCFFTISISNNNQSSEQRCTCKDKRVERVKTKD